MPSRPEILIEPWTALGFGGMAGLVVGFAAKKLTKVLAVALGLLFVTLQGLSYLGYVQIDWTGIERDASRVVSGPEGRALLDQAWLVLVANIPFAGGFAAGFALGFKLG